MSTPYIQKFSLPQSSCLKQWNDAEIKKMLDFVKRNKEEHEKPSAKIFYEAMIHETGIEGYWPHIRCQMRFLKMTLLRACGWLSNVDLETIDEKWATDYARNRYCPYYDQLVEIFGTDLTALDVWNDCHCNTSFSSDENEDTSGYVIVEKERNNKRISTENQHGASDPKIPRKESHLEEAKLQFEDDKYQWAKEKENRALKMEEKKIENELILKWLELEHKKEIAMYEVKMKYNPVVYRYNPKI